MQASAVVTWLVLGYRNHVNGMYLHVKKCLDQSIIVALDPSNQILSTVRTNSPPNYESQYKFSCSKIRTHA
ncbi:hypothetical protein GQ55_8G190300 [Panicum hallii var. hallii]|uniref:Uncharacterized protein n=1 Tax=Panicum hallii var. hallii TaxID=1504633 RepID=A0A2T7CP15_9POAL|nr:hypothetical protein GQ55_8G190300 [Panicum hallii var. hallii]